MTTLFCSASTSPASSCIWAPLSEVPSRGGHFAPTGGQPDNASDTPRPWCARRVRSNRRQAGHPSGCQERLSCRRQIADDFAMHVSIADEVLRGGVHAQDRSARVTAVAERRGRDIARGRARSDDRRVRSGGRRRCRPRSRALCDNARPVSGRSGERLPVETQPELTIQLAVMTEITALEPGRRRSRLADRVRRRQLRCSGRTGDHAGGTSWCGRGRLQRCSRHRPLNHSVD